MIQVPLSEPKGAPQGLWAQREYVEARRRGFGFTAHGDWWHYLVGLDILSVRVTLGSAGRAVVSRAADRLQWIDQARKIAADAEARGRQ